MSVVPTSDDLAQPLPLLPVESLAGIRSRDGSIFYIQGHWDVTDGQPACVGIEIWKDAIPVGDNRTTSYRPLRNEARSGIRAVDVRAINFGRVLRQLWDYANEEDKESRREIAELAKTLQAHAEAGEIDLGQAKDIVAHLNEVLAWEPLFADRKRKQRKQADDKEHFERVAAVYSAAVRAREAPTRAVERAFGCSYSTATKWVAKARDRYGLLSPTKAGYASAALPTTRTKDGGK